MAPLFGHKEENQANAAALLAEIQPLGFGPGAPGEDPDGTVTVGGPNIDSGPTIGSIAAEYATGGGISVIDPPDRLGLQRLVAEGIQALEHASLIRAQLHTAMGGLDYALTRLGRAAIQQNAVDRILSGGTL